MVLLFVLEKKGISTVPISDLPSRPVFFRVDNQFPFSDSLVWLYTAILQYQRTSTLQHGYQYIAVWLCTAILQYHNVLLYCSMTMYCYNVVWLSAIILHCLCTAILQHHYIPLHFRTVIYCYRSPIKASVLPCWQSVPVFWQPCMTIYRYTAVSTYLYIAAWLPIYCRMAMYCYIAVSQCTAILQYDYVLL